MDLDTSKCLKIANGKVCSVNDVSKLDAFINQSGYDREDLKFKNGERTIVNDSNGNWKMTVLKYKENGVNYVVF